MLYTFKKSILTSDNDFYVIGGYKDKYLNDIFKIKLDISKINLIF